MSDSASIVADTAARILADLADPQTINQAKTAKWKAPLWRALEEAGLTLAWVPDDLGGAGASLEDGFAVVSAASRAAAGVPLAETLMAGWLLSQARIAAPPSAMTLVPVRPADRIVLGSDGTLSGRARAVPFAADARHIAVLAHGPQALTVALVDAKACRVGDGRTLAGDNQGDVLFERTVPLATAPAPPAFDQTALMLMGCTVRAAQTAGALEAILAMAVRYANDRVAFERPIAKFQAVQHNLARLAGEVSAAVTASGSAANAISRGETDAEALFLEAASAKIRCVEAAQEGAAIAHQVHGAVGFTQEYILHRYTLRLLGWRDDFGNESHWAVELGRRVAGRGADELWPLVASR